MDRRVEVLTGDAKLKIAREKNRKHVRGQGIIALVAWIIFLILAVNPFFRIIVPSHSQSAINNPYTMDSVWDKEENKWHNDVLLNTLFAKKPVYINPESWYVDYVCAFATSVILDERIEVFQDAGDMLIDSYTCLNHMIAIQNSTLFRDEVIDIITRTAPEGAALLYIDESSVASAEGILLLHDQYGNLYLKGYGNEEAR